MKQYTIMESEETPLKFPCMFPVKAMGAAEEGFDGLVVSLVRRHSPDLAESAVKTRLSRNGNYMSVTVTVEARSREQLDAIYTDLTAHERVLIAL